MSSQSERLEYKLKHNNWDQNDQKTKLYTEMLILSHRLDEMEHLYGRRAGNLSGNTGPG